MVKRSSSAVSPDLDNHDHISNAKSILLSPSDSEVDIKPKKKAKTTKANKDKDGKQVRNRVAWTAEEDAIYLQIVEGIVRENLWAAVKADGRLVHRKAAGVLMHIPSIIKGLKGK